jgi:glycosyltransferase involved in cell wall biosynthesis
LRIALVGPSWPFKGGIAYYTTRLYRELRHQHQVEFYTFSRQYPALLYPGQSDRDESNLALKEEAARPLIDSLNPVSLYRTVRAIAAFDPELLVLPWWVMFWAPHFTWLARALKRRRPRCKIVFLCHNVIAHDSGAVSRLLTRWTLRNGDAFLVQSRRDHEQLLGMFPGAVVERIEHPSYDLYEAGGIGRETARQALKLGRHVALFLGFVRPYKGVDVLLEALPKVLEQVDLETVIVGEFWEGTQTYSRKLDELRLSERVRLVDRYIPHEEVPYWLAACDVVVLPYLEATGSGVLKLAYGCGRSVIASRVGSLGDEVVDGKTGLLVRPGDAGELADALIRFYREDLRDTLETGVLQQRRQFSWQAAVSALQRLSRHPPVRDGRP